MLRGHLLDRRLRPWSLALLSGIPWIAALGFAPSPRHPDPADWTLWQWEKWRDDQIRDILTPTFPYGRDSLLRRQDVILQSAQAYNVLAPLANNPAFLGDPARARALGNFWRFVRGQHWMALQGPSGRYTNLLGMDLDDRQYWNYAQSYVQFPPLLESQEFLRRMANPTQYASAVGMIEQQNQRLPWNRRWIVYPYRAQFIPSVDTTTFGRLLVVVPNEPMGGGKTLDRWILFAIATPEMRPGVPIRSVSIISILRDEASPGKYEAFFSDFMRDYDPRQDSIEIHPNVFMNPSPSKNCFDCHKSAIIAIRPKVAYRFDPVGNLVVDSQGGEARPPEVNRLIQGYGRREFEHLDDEAYGPSLGPVDRVRSDAFMTIATKDVQLPLTSIDRIRKAMNCASCHSQFAPVNFMMGVRTDRDVTAFETSIGLTQTYIEKGWMPPNNTLTPNERHALWQCLMKEYFDPETGRGDFVTWLRGG